MESIITLFNFFGITSVDSPFVVLAGLMIGLTAWQRVSLNVRFDRIESTLGKMKTNIKIIATFLATIYPDKFNIALIEEMSPLQIKEAGYALLNKSGFTAIIKDPGYRDKILSFIADESPNSKLDVQNYAIIYFPTILDEKFMLPIKSCLYNFPKDRESLLLLAGLYIRDEYLKDHPEIKQ